MPLLLTPPEPFHTTAHVPVAQVYAVINAVAYSRATQVIAFAVGYYASEAACDAGAGVLAVDALPTGFSQPATPQQANGVPIFDFLDYALQAQLEALHPTAAVVRI